MEPQHAARVRELDPGSSDRVHIITEQGLNPGGTTTSVADPIGGSADQYRDTFNRMRSHLLEWVSVIRDAVERREGVR
jgi:protein-tyrosine-phosphatase